MSKNLVKTTSGYRFNAYFSSKHNFSLIEFSTGNINAVKILLDNGANANTYHEKAKISALQEAFLNSMLHTNFK